MYCRRILFLLLFMPEIMIAQAADRPLYLLAEEHWNTTRTQKEMQSIESTDSTETVKGIYGTDNRIEAYMADKNLQRAANSTAAFFAADQLEATDRGYRLIPGLTLKDNNWCDSEPFVNQPTQAFCSGFLVDKDVLVTAGHCVKAMDIKDMRIVFGYQLGENKVPQNQFSSQDVYKIKEVLEVNNAGGNDWGVVRLDRATSRPVPAIRRGETPLATNLTVIGYPLGLPLKIAEGGTVFAYEGSMLKTNLDAYHGNSGSPVFNTDSIQRGKPMIEGILVNGADDAYITQEGCKVSMQCKNDSFREGRKCSGEYVTKISLVVADDSDVPVKDELIEQESVSSQNLPASSRIREDETSSQHSPAKQDAKSNDMCNVMPSLC